MEMVRYIDEMVLGSNRRLLYNIAVMTQKDIKASVHFDRYYTKGRFVGNINKMVLNSNSK